MKLAILLMIHKNLEQVKRLITALSHPCITVFIHPDKKMSFNQADLELPGVVLLPEEKRVDVRWGAISLVDATLNLLDYALKYDKFDYYWICSGQDFPLVKSDEIVLFLQKKRCNFIDFWESHDYKYNKDNHLDKRNKIWFPVWIISTKLYLRILKRLYIEITGGYNRTWRIFERKSKTVNKFYFGSEWWCLNTETVSWINEYLDKHPDYYRFYMHSLCPDESFFHTLVMMSPYKNNIEEYLHYIDWSQGGNHPKILTCNDYQAIIESGKLMARKFDIDIDKKIFDLIQSDDD